MPLMPESDHGVLSGYYSFSRGLGTWLGPLLAGLSISALDGVFGATQGYQAMWLPVSVAALLSILPLRVITRSSGGRDPRRRDAARAPAAWLRSRQARRGRRA
jgi:hypothetical protein